jgi:hypothetical protein
VEVEMTTNIRYRTFLIRPFVTTNANGRFSASAVITDPSDEERTVGVDGDFGRRQEAVDRAVEVAMAQIDQRRIASDHHMRG